MINKHKSNKIKENSKTVRHLNNGTDHRHSKSCCDQSSPARRTITFGHHITAFTSIHKYLLMSNHIWFSERLSKMVLHISIGNVGNGRHGLFPPETAILRSFHNFAQWLNLVLLPTKQPKILGKCFGPNPNKHMWLQLYP